MAKWFYSIGPCNRFRNWFWFRLEAFQKNLVLLDDEVAEGGRHSRGVPRYQVRQLSLGLDLLVLGSSGSHLKFRQ